MRRSPTSIAVMVLSLGGLVGGIGCVYRSYGDEEPELAPPVPTVREVGPREGSYGTTLTAAGDNLGGARITARSPTGDEIELPLVDPAAPAASSGSSGSSRGADAGSAPITSLRFRYAFPAEGEMTMTSPGGALPLGAFLPSWTPGRPATAEGAVVLGAGALGADTAVLSSSAGGLAFTVFGQGEPRRIPVPGSSPGVVTGSALRVAGALLEAAIVGDGRASRVTFDGTTARSEPYVTSGTVLGVGVDEIGLVVVVSTPEGTLVRLRGEPSAPTPQGAAVTVPPSVAARKGVLAVSGNGTVVHAYAGDGGNFLDDVASYSMAALAPGADAFSTPRSLGSLDDTFKSLRAETRGGVVEIHYCATDSGFFQSTKEVCGSARTVDGQTRLELGSVASGDGALVSAAGRTSHARCGEGDMLLVQSDTATQSGVAEPTLFPCHGQSVSALVFSDSGTRVVVEDRRGRLWVARRR